MDQLEENLGGINVQVLDEDRKYLDAVAAPGQMIVPYYESNFGPHQYHWP